MSVLIIEKQPTYRECILNLSEWESIKVPFSKRASIAPMISKLKKEIEFHKRRYSAMEIHEGKQHLLLITRLEDSND